MQDSFQSLFEANEMLWSETGKRDISPFSYCQLHPFPPPPKLFPFQFIFPANILLRKLGGRGRCLWKALHMNIDARSLDCIFCFKKAEISKSMLVLGWPQPWCTTKHIVDETSKFVPIAKKICASRKRHLFSIGSAEDDPNLPLKLGWENGVMRFCPLKIFSGASSYCG